MSALPTKAFPDTDIEVSVVGIGCNAFGQRVDAAGVSAIVHTALDVGVTFFDTADSYNNGASETLLGEALRGRRDDVVVATKFGMDMTGETGPHEGKRGSADYVRGAVEASLRRLQTDHIDLVQYHTPDPQTPFEETLGALHGLVEAGKVRAIGSSNLAAWEVVDVHHRAREADLTPFVSAQNEYSLYNRAAEAELIPACDHVGVGLLPYFPLAYGLLTGKYRRGQGAPSGSRLSHSTQARRLEAADFTRIEALQAFADERGLTMLDVAVGALASRPAVTSVIAGVSRPEQVRANARAARWEPSETDWAALDEASPVPAVPSYRPFAP